jgi:hypothetical protein
MDSNANAWAWNTRLTPNEISRIVAYTRTTANHFYQPHELLAPAELSPTARQRPSSPRRPHPPRPTRRSAKTITTRLALLASWLTSIGGGPPDP